MDPELQNPPQSPLPAPPMPARAVVVLVGGLLATWLAGGLLGWIAPPLQRTLIWLALGTVVCMALGGRRRPHARTRVVSG